MKTCVFDKKALAAVRPEALSAYARAHGWIEAERFGRHSHVYVRAGAPEIVIPEVQRLGDYANIVLRLVEIFAEVSETDEISLYRGLLTFDRDIVRVRAAADCGNGSVTLDDGVNLITGARDMMRAAARSLHRRGEFLRGRMPRETEKYMRNVQLGQTEQGSFVVTLLGPVVSAPPTGPDAHIGTIHDDAPLEQRTTHLLEDALRATRNAANRAATNVPVSFAGADAFSRIVERGASANLFKAIAMMIGPFSEIDITLSWAFTRPVAAEKNVRFRASDAPILREGEKLLRNGRSRNEKARTLVGEIQAKRKEATSLLKRFLKRITAEMVSADPDAANKAVESVSKNPVAPTMDHAIAAAILLQQRGDFKGAIEKWRAIANIADGFNPEIGARAWFSVGYLCREGRENDHLAAIDAYDHSVRLKPDYAEAYYNRGVAKSDLGRHEQAIADYDEAIRLKPDYAEAYSNRGGAKSKLGRHEDAIADHDEAIRLRPDAAFAYYNRGVANTQLDRMDAAQQDLKAALAKARDAGDEALAEGVKRALDALLGGNG